MARRPYWEDNGYTTEWFWLQSRLRSVFITEQDVKRALARFPAEAVAECVMLRTAGWRVPGFVMPSDVRLGDLPLFAAGERVLEVA